MASQSSVASSSAPSLASIVFPSEIGDAPTQVSYSNATWLSTPHIPRIGHDSRIWEFGTEYVKQTDVRINAWRCNLCVGKEFLAINVRAGSGNARTHLLRKHQIDIRIVGPGADDSDVYIQDNLITASLSPQLGLTPSPSPVPTGQLRMFAQSVNLDRYRNHLVRWIVEHYLPFNIVANEHFQQMLLALNNALSDKLLMNNCNSVQNLIWTEFIDAKLEIRDKVLANAKSAIHISYDLWSSLNGYALCGIAGHFVDAHYKIYSVLLGLRRMREAHTSEQIGHKMIGVIEEYGIQEKLGVFISDNVESNDIV